MGKIVLIVGVSLLVLGAQEPPADSKAKSAYKSVIGEVTALDPAAKQINLKTDAGVPASVPLDEKTSYLRIPPGEKDLKKATRIAIADIGVGDRVLARVRAAEEQSPAVSVIVINKAELAQHHEKAREEWVRRGFAGKIAAIDPATKQVTLKVQTPTGLKDVIVEAGEKVTYRRYAPDSVRFSDAKPSTFAELKTGDNMRVLGDKNEDGTRIKPEEIVSGTFHNIAGTVLAVDAAANEIKITNLETKKPMTIKVNSDTSLKKLPPMMAQGMARMRQGGAAAPPGAPAGVPAGGDAARPRMGAGGPGMAGRGGGDFQAMLEKVPQFSLTELKPGDALIISSTAGTDASRVTAITLVAGVEPLLTAPAGASQQQNMSNVLSFDIAMPQ